MNTNTKKKQKKQTNKKKMYMHALCHQYGNQVRLRYIITSETLSNSVAVMVVMVVVVVLVIVVYVLCGGIDWTKRMTKDTLLMKFVPYIHKYKHTYMHAYIHILFFLFFFLCWHS